MRLIALALLVLLLVGLVVAANIDLLGYNPDKLKKIKVDKWNGTSMKKVDGYKYDATNDSVNALELFMYINQSQ